MAVIEVANPIVNKLSPAVTRYRNESGGTLDRGDLVFVSGWDAGTGAPLVLLADADAAGRAAEFVVTVAAVNNANGVMGTYLRLTGEDTSSVAAAEDPLFLSTTPGDWTATDPTDADPNGISQRVGYAETDDASGIAVFDLLAAGPEQIGTNEIQDEAITGAKVAAAAAIARTKLAQEALVPFRIPLVQFRVFDAFQTNLPGTAANDDMALISGTHATAAPMLEGKVATGSATETNKARVTFQLPAEYDDGQTITLRLHCRTSGGQGEGTKTIDAIVVSNDEDGTVSGDIVTTSVITVNDTFTDRDFTITPTGLASGEELDILLISVIQDAGVDGKFQCAFVELLLDIRG